MRSRPRRPLFLHWRWLQQHISCTLNEWMRWLTIAIEIRTQTFKKDEPSSATVVGLGWTSLSLPRTSSQRCWIRFKCGLRTGHGITSMLFCWRNYLVNHAEWARPWVLSCWKFVVPMTCKNGNAWGFRARSVKQAAVTPLPLPRPIF